MCEGHQKKLMLAVKRLAELQRSTDGWSSLRKKPPPITQQQEVTSVDGPPPDGTFTRNSLMNSTKSTNSDKFFLNLYLCRNLVSKDEHFPGQQFEQ